jgi:diguanylate cyclase (GGDEF)-like protein
MPPEIKSDEIPYEQDLRRIEKREWQLWTLTIALLMIFGTVTILTFFILGEDHGNDGILSSVADRALAGLFILISLFSAYVLHARGTFGRMRRLLEKQAMRDSLTGLINRQYFSERVEEEKVRADRNRSIMAILLCDLDRFKTINDTQGHHVGDEMLKLVAMSFKESTRGIDLVFRWGGDEILIVLADTTREGVRVAAERIRKGVLKISEKTNLELDVSIGIALYPEHGKRIDDLIQLADRALYIAKEGGGKIHVGDEEYKVDDHSVEIVFQPVIETQSGATIGYEALSRDPQGKLGILEFFKRYQAVGQLTALKCLCFKMQITKAAELGLRKVFINTNFEVLKQLDTLPKPAGLEVILEISESEALHDIENFLQITGKWRAKGFKFAIDDFGAGFISLPFIARLIPDYIKMDRSAILQAVSSEQFGRFLKDLVQALRNYSREGIIAEGIESEKELKVVKDIGGHLVQGYFVGRPRPLKQRDSKIEP